LIANCILYTYFDAEPELLRTVLSGWYSIGDNWYYVNNNSGTINSTGTCDGGTSPECECYRVTNEGGRNDGGITFTYNRCSDGILDELTVGPGSSRTVCVQNGTDINSDSGLMTVSSCPDPCTTNGDCVECA
jgi:hypothetical protein